MLMDWIKMGGDKAGSKEVSLITPGLCINPLTAVPADKFPDISTPDFRINARRTAGKH